MIQNHIYIKKAVLYFVFCLCYTLIFSQNSAQEDDVPLNEDLGLSQIIPPSPSAGSLGKFGDFPVNMAFGTPNISFPLLNISVGDLNQSITLTYNASGNKVIDWGEWPGLGWNLNYGGVISRTVIGKPDEGQNGFLMINDGYTDIFINGVDQTIDENFYFVKGVVEGTHDTKPDVFSYNFNGYSGKFVYDNSGKIQLIPYQPLDITPIYGEGNEASLGIVGFDIRTPEGIVYKFREYERTTIQSGTNYQDYTSAWYLTDIIAANGADNIFFQYKDKPPKIYPSEKTHIYKYSSPGIIPTYSILDSQEKTFYTQKEITEKRIESISFSSRSITFDYINDKIQLINIEGEVIKEISLNVGEFTNSNDCSDNLCDRKKLNGFTIGEQEWKFEYESIPEPPRNTFNKDHWGYYNGADNDDNPIPNYEIYGNTYGGGADRKTDQNLVKFGLLKKITYPTGGYTKFLFGVNKIANVTINGEVEATREDIFSETLVGESASNIIEQYEWPGEVYLPVAPGTPESNITWYPQVNILIEFGMQYNGNGVQYVQIPKF